MATTQHSIQYNKEFLALVKDLCKISQAFTIKKIAGGDKIEITTTNNSRSIAYRLEAPVSVFDFEGDKISFADFVSFYSFYSSGVFAGQEVILTQKNPYITIATSDSRFKYRLVDERATPKVPNLPSFKNVDAKFSLSSDLLEILRSNGQLVNAEEMSIRVESDRVKTCQYSARYQHKFERVFLYDDSGVTEDNPVDINIYNIVIACVPQGPKGNLFNYNVEISNGNIKFSPEIEHISGLTLDIYTTQNQKEGEDAE